MQPIPIRFHRSPDNFDKLFSSNIGHRFDALIAQHPPHKVSVVFTSIHPLKNAHWKFSACEFVELGTQRLTGIAVDGIGKFGEPLNKLLIELWRC